MEGSPLRYAYIGFFTLTDALRARELLRSHGIRARVERMPSGQGISCAYGLKLSAKSAEEANEILRGSGIRQGKTIYRKENGVSDNDLF